MVLKLSKKVEKKNTRERRKIISSVFLIAGFAAIHLVRDSRTVGSFYTSFDSNAVSGDSYRSYFGLNGSTIDDNASTIDLLFDSYSSSSSSSNNNLGEENVNVEHKHKHKHKHNTSQTSAQKQNPPKTEKPWLVYHIGPPKTATTTIQNGLQKYSSHLASHDNVFYLGQTLSYTKYFEYEEFNSTNGTGIKNHSPLIKAMSLMGENPTPTMQWHLKEKHNVVISSELFTSWLAKKKNYHFVFDNLFLQKGGWSDAEHGHGNASKPILSEGARIIPAYRRRLKEETKDDRLKNFLNHDVSSDFGFDTKVVAVYRHYFQWLASYYYQCYVQWMGFRRKDPPSLIDYVESTLEELGEKYHVDETEFDFTNATQLQKLHTNIRIQHGTLYAYLKWTAPRSLRYRVDLFDMHQQQIKPANETNASDKPDVFRDFICQALPNAPSTCLRLHQDKEEIVSRARKTSTGSPLETGELSTTQFDRLRQKTVEWFPQLSKKDTNKPRTYENVSEKDFTGFARLKQNFKSWVDARAKRLQESGETDDGHRWLCLSEESTKKLRNASWNMLRHLEALVRIREEATKGKDDSYIFEAPDNDARPKHPLLLSPNKHRHTPQDEQGDWWGRIKRDHDDLFDKTIANGVYCELDFERLFADDDFVLHVFYGKHN